MRAAVLLVLLCLAGCQTVAGRWLAVEDARGNVSRVLHLDGVPCPTAISAAPDTAGCYYNGPVVFTAGAESLGAAQDTLQHELDHHRGLQHGPWRMVGGAKCALVLAQGRTPWIAGRLLCRSDRYFQMNPDS